MVMYICQARRAKNPSENEFQILFTLFQSPDSNSAILKYTDINLIV